MAARRLGFCLLRIALVVFCLLGWVSSGGSQGGQRQNTSQTREIQSIYAKNPDDSWNRIFYCLFSRRMTFRYSNEFPEGAPFSPSSFISMSPSTRDLQVSTRVFERFETGDRPIDPLYPIDPQYPSPFKGAGQILTDPLYTQLTEALREAQNDNTKRPVLARALMQSDLWSAFDILDAYPSENLGEQRELLLGMLAHLIRKIALTPAEIESLPDNFSLSVGKSGLPDLFRPESGWMEIQWLTPRDHDISSRFRRVSRVFMKPAHSAVDTQALLDSLRGSGRQNAAVDLDGVAIVTQLLLIDSQGKLTPSRVTTEAQLRLFTKTPDGKFKSTETQAYELSRGLVLSRGASGGFIVEDDSAPAYLPFGGNDFTFASRQFSHGGADPPLLVKSRTRCAACHGSDVTSLISFASHTEPTASTPHVAQLNPTLHEAADFVISQKAARQDWSDLLDYADIVSPR